VVLVEGTGRSAVTDTRGFYRITAVPAGVRTVVTRRVGYAPVTDRSREFMSARLLTFGYDGPTIPWSSFGEHLEFLSGVGHSPNLAWFVGHNAIRLAAGVSGPDPTEAQSAAMDRFMREAMEAGALGMSTGLEFNPGREARIEELERLNAIAGEFDGIYTSHVRNRDSGILEAIAEFLQVARAGGIRAEISHLNVRHNTNAPERGWERAVELMAAARDEGMDVLADTTPFVDGLGALAGILPPWVSADGTEAALAPDAPAVWPDNEAQAVLGRQPLARERAGALGRCLVGRAGVQVALWCRRGAHTRSVRSVLIARIRPWRGRQPRPRQSPVRSLRRPAPPAAVQCPRP